MFSDSEEDERFSSGEEEEEGSEEEDYYVEEDDDMGFEVDLQEQREERGKLNPKHYTVLTTDQVIEEQMQAMKQANDIIQVDESTIRNLLKYTDWDVEKLLQQFLEEGREKLFKAAGIEVSDAGAADATEVPDDGMMECNICFDDIDPETACSLSCKHKFCGNCWKEYLTLKITEEGRKASSITCMAKGCKVQMEESMVKKLVDPKVYKKYMRFMLDSYIDRHQYLNWCPAARCETVVKIKTKGRTNLSVTCDCGGSFCFKCLQEPHQPATCTMLKLWQAKASDDSETVNWLRSNTKTCPQCSKAVEKNGGCNHISCTCGAHFCWMCLGLFDTSTVYRHNCNMFEDSQAFSNDEAQSAKALLDRYVHYCTRYETHHKSKQLEAPLLDKMQQKAEQLAEVDIGNPSWIDHRYLSESTKQLFNCREILKWTYVFAFYIFDPGYSQGNTQAMLEDFRPFLNKEEMTKAKEQYEFHQEELETTTERLSGMLEMPVEKILQTENYRIKVMDLTRMALNKFNAMFDVIDWIRTNGATGFFERKKRDDKKAEDNLSASDGKGKGKARDIELSKSTSTGLMETMEVTKKFWNSSKPLKMTCSISKTPYPPGHEMVIEVRVENQCGKKLKSFKVCIEQVTTYPFIKKKKPKVERIGATQEYKKETELAVPDYEGYLDFMLPSYISYSTPSITHRLVVELVVKGGTGPKAYLPVTIGQRN